MDGLRKGKVNGELSEDCMGGLRSWYEESCPYSILQVPSIPGDTHKTSVEQFEKVNSTFKLIEPSIKKVGNVLKQNSCMKEKIRLSGVRIA